MPSLLEGLRKEYGQPNAHPVSQPTAPAQGIGLLSGLQAEYGPPAAAQAQAQPAAPTFPADQMAGLMDPIDFGQEPILPPVADPQGLAPAMNQPYFTPPVKSFGAFEAAPERTLGIERFGKGLYNKVISDSMKPVIDMEVVSQANQRAEQRAIREAGGDHDRYLELSKKYTAEEHEKLSGTGLRFDLPDAETAAEKIADFGSGTAAFLLKMAAARRAAPTAPPAAVFESVNQAEGGVPGRGLAMGNTLSAIGNAIPSGRLFVDPRAQKLIEYGVKPAATGTVFATMTAMEGGSAEEVATSFMMPYVYKAISAGTGSLAKTKVATVNKMKSEMKKAGVDTSKIPGKAYDQAWNAAKKQRQLDLDMRSGKISREQYVRGSNEVANEISAIRQSIQTRMQGAKPVKSTTTQTVPVTTPPEPTPAAPKTPGLLAPPAVPAPKAAVPTVPAVVPAAPVEKGPLASAKTPTSTGRKTEPIRDVAKEGVETYYRELANLSPEEIQAKFNEKGMSLKGRGRVHIDANRQLEIAVSDGMAKDIKDAEKKIKQYGFESEQDRERWTQKGFSDLSENIVDETKASNQRGKLKISSPQSEGKPIPAEVLAEYPDMASSQGGEGDIISEAKSALRSGRGSKLKKSLLKSSIESYESGSGSLDSVKTRLDRFNQEADKMSADAEASAKEEQERLLRIYDTPDKIKKRMSWIDKELGKKKHETGISFSGQYDPRGTLSQEKIRLEILLKDFSSPSSEAVAGKPAAVEEVEKQDGQGMQGKKLYHGSSKKWAGEFKSPVKGEYGSEAIFLAESERGAEYYVRDLEQGEIKEVSVDQNAKIWDFENSEDIQIIADHIDKVGMENVDKYWNKGKDEFLEEIKNGRYDKIQRPALMELLRNNGYDGFRQIDWYDYGQDISIGIFDPKKLSALSPAPQPQAQPKISGLKPAAVEEAKPFTPPAKTLSNAQRVADQSGKPVYIAKTKTGNISVRKTKPASGEFLEVEPKGAATKVDGEDTPERAWKKDVSAKIKKIEDEMDRTGYGTKKLDGLIKKRDKLVDELRAGYKPKVQAEISNTRPDVSTEDGLRRLSFNTIENFTETEGVGKNKSIRYRKATYNAIAKDGKEYDYSVRTDTEGKTTVQKGSITPEQKKKDLQDELDTVPQSIIDTVDSLEIPFSNEYQRVKVISAVAGNNKSKSVNAILTNRAISERILELFPGIKTTDEAIALIKKKAGPKVTATNPAPPVQTTGKVTTKAAISSKPQPKNMAGKPPTKSSGGGQGSPKGGRGIRGMKLDLEPEGKLPRKIVNKHLIIRALSKAFKVPIKGLATNKMRAYVGKYWSDKKGIRMVKSKDILTAAHEVGHHIDHAYGIKASRSSLPAGAKAELVKMGKDLYGNKKPNGGYANEGVAEYIHGYMTESIDVAKVAPAFNKWFNETYFKDYPEIKTLLETSQELYRQYKKQGARARIRGSRYKGMIPSTLSDAAKRFFLKLETQWRDELAPLLRGMERAGIDRGKLTPDKDPYSIAVAFADKAGSKAIQFVLEGTTDLAGNVTGLPLREILRPVSKDIERFIDWAEAAKALQLAKLGIDPGIEIADAKYIYEKDKSDVYEKALKEWTDWNRAGMRYMVEAGAMTQEAFDTIVKKHPIYIPFQRAFEKGEKARGGSGAGKGFVNAGSPIKKIKGSDRPRVDPIMASLQNMEKMISVSQKTAVARAVAGLSENNGVAGLIWEVPAPQQSTTFSAEKIKQDVVRLAKEHLGLDIDPADINAGGQWDDLVTVFTNAEQYRGKENIVKIRLDGENRWFEVHPEMFEVLMGLDHYTLPPFLNMTFGAATRGLRLGATGINASFGLVRNFIRDTLFFSAMAKHAKGGPLSTTLGVVKDIANTRDARKFKAMGGKMSGQIGQDISTTKRLRKQVFSVGAKKWTMYTVTHPVNAIRELFGVTESGSRIGEFGPALKYAEAKWGKGSLSAAIYALNAGQDVTTNFTRHGRIAKVINQVVPFFNANIQGKDKSYRTFKERPISTALKAIAGLTVPALLLWFMNKDEEWYENLPAYEKANYLHFRIPGTQNIVRIPVPFELGYAFQTLPVAAIDALYKNEPEAAKDIFRIAGKQTSPDFAPALISPLIDIWRNEDFAGRPIVPKSAEGKLPEDQVTPYTSALMKEIGKALKVSPAQAEHLVNSYTGGLYGRAARSIEGNAEVDRPFELSDIPVYGTLFLREDQKHRPSAKIDRFYNKLDELNRKHASKKATPKEELQWKAYNKASRTLSDNWKIFRENPGMGIERRKFLYRRIERNIDAAMK